MFDSTNDLAAKLAATGYFIDPVMTQVVFLAAKLQKPLLLEGPAGSGKSREMALNNTPPDKLPVFDKVPRSKLALPGLIFKFLGKTSIFLYTEALGRRDWHGRTAILVDEHTAGAAEMVAQFAQENRLATLVGMKTPGRLVTRRASKLGFGYRLVIPIAAYVSAKGTQIEGNGITPDISIPWSSEDAAAGIDRQLIGAVDALRAA